MSFEKEKRKNDQRRRGFLPVWAWTLILGFILGIVFTILTVMTARVETVSYSSGDSLTSNTSDEAIYATATYIIQQATGEAQTEKQTTQNAASGLYATATYLVEQTTATQAAILTITAKP
ncbi:MAG: hypothetical protein ABI690_04850 [Chloroflexota bacterium]